jgi:prophage regulatory protein
MNMLDIPLRKASVSHHQQREKNSGQTSLPRQFAAKKMPLSQEPSEADLRRSSDTLDDVTFLRLPEVKAVTGLGKTSIYGFIRNNSFPAPVRLGPRAVAWVKSEIKQWALERVQASRSVA